MQLTVNNCLIIRLIVLVNLTNVFGQHFCRTPGFKTGICVSIFECDYLLNILKVKPLTQASIKFLKMSQCDSGLEHDPSTPYVCCARNDNSLGFQTKERQSIVSPKSDNISFRESSNYPVTKMADSRNELLPQQSECGREFIENRIYSGQNTEREEFPWLALLEYRKLNGDLSIHCAGSLINKKYIITASHCLTGDIIYRIGTLANVRLGDYDLNANQNCADGSCGNPTRMNEIEEIIPHENFNSRTTNRRHDIGLIRLKRSVLYSSSIRPICLPNHSSPGMVVGESAYVVGFGRTLHSSTSPIKQKLQIPIFDHLKCKAKFQTKNVDILDDQICAGGEFSRDTCDGDSGGPMMRFRDNWAIEGIVSFGYLCGLQGWPAIYTKVSSYTEWIHKHIKP